MSYSRLLSRYIVGERDFRGIDLRGVDLRGINFRQLDLREANLSGINLETVDFHQAYLCGANLSHVNLMKANFTEANLQKVNYRFQIAQYTMEVVNRTMDISDEKLQVLLSEIQNHLEPLSLERRRRINRLLIYIQHLPGLLRSSHPTYLEALDNTFLWISENIEKFQPRENLSLQQSLLQWIHGYLYWRIKDLYIKDQASGGEDKNDTFSLDQVINLSDENLTTWIEQMTDTNLGVPTLSGLDGYIEQLRQQDRQQTSTAIEEYIETDPQGILRSCHPRKFPQCNCQVLSKELLLRNPPNKLSVISREFCIHYQTLRSHWGLKCKPLLQKIAVNLGYKVD